MHIYSTYVCVYVCMLEGNCSRAITMIKCAPTYTHTYVHMFCTVCSRALTVDVCTNTVTCFLCPVVGL